tara:strand:+ start:10 stop:600 length:591 start_codon:yes stop_codon:yes gene_type:complete
MSPAKSTFLVWAAFIIGGAGNNRGMLIGAMVITLTEFLFNVLVAAQSSPDLALGDTAKVIDENFVWMIESPLEISSYLLIFSIVLFVFRRYGASETLFWFSFIFMACHFMFDQRSIDLVFPEVLGGIQVQMTYVKLMLIGLLIMVSLKYNPKGLLPEVPYRPERPVVSASFSKDQAIAAIPDYDELNDEEANTDDE